MLVLGRDQPADGWASVGGPTVIEISPPAKLEQRLLKRGIVEGRVSSSRPGRRRY